MRTRTRIPEAGLDVAEKRAAAASVSSWKTYGYRLEAKRSCNAGRCSSLERGLPTERMTFVIVKRGKRVAGAGRES
jgi:hypothetical protein